MSRGNGHHGVQLVEQIDALLDRMDHLGDPEARDTAQTLTRALLQLHKEGLARILGVTTSLSSDTKTLTARLVEDDWINSLLLIHDLHPDSLEARARRACEQVRPLITSGGGDVHFLDARSCTVRLRYVSDGTTSLTRTLRQVLEETILAAVPEAGAVLIEEATVFPLLLLE